MQKRFTNGLAVAAVLLSLMLSASAPAQIVGLYYQEVAKDGRIYVFNTY